MKFYVGVTDNQWYGHLSRQQPLDEVNFWHPNGSPPFTGEPEGTLFLFKLKRPHHHIAGGGYFIKYESLPLDLAWEAFGECNGAPSFTAFADLIHSARRNTSDPNRDVGCSILGSPFFFPQSDWIPMGDDFAASIVRGKFFDSSRQDGARLWSAVQDRLLARPLVAAAVHERLPTYGEPALVRPRRGQGTFRALVTNAYSRRCAITGESTLPTLEAAHIKPVAEDGLFNTFNGMLLRSDFHRLFDKGLVTVTPEYRVLVSRQIKEQWFNGKAYYRLHGEQLKVIPAIPTDQPRRDFLAWHNQFRFREE